MLYKLDVNRKENGRLQMDIKIREISESDYSEIVSIWNNELGSPNVNLDNISERIARMNKDDNYKIFVALFESNVVGCI